ncbi:phage tail sheath subtilisin-like domain-containing protein [Rhodopseudomonas sp. BR0G17]|uniref:phage tail sheath subtilisin-like domain-containing protein n=1 Tax=Rhodopseudomonas sp. BR0G17 TaxID=2269368 RepID=UPI001967B347|nr:phage tail sheath subtilisin-like domain-containing protein [Rhodopseudomonas sp. BR0G17]NEW96643.1 hypothetical protein [Rhodopseudomonas sp. BR0G17]
MANDVAFNNIPGNILVPFWYAEINSGGSPFENVPRVILFGQKTADGSAPAGKVIGPIASAAEADAYFGVGSMLAMMYRRARLTAPFQPLWAMPLADPVGAFAAGSFTFTAPGVTGAAILRIMGRRYAFQVNAAHTAAQVAANAAATINAANLAVTAAVDGTDTSKVIFTARHKGAVSNGQQVDIARGEPNALTDDNTTVVALTGGSGVPDLIAPLANLGDDEYDCIASPYTDTPSLDAFRDFLDDVSGRWSPSKQLYGHHFSCFYGNLSSCVALTNARNDQHSSIVLWQRSPTPEWEICAGAAAQAAAHLGDAPEVSRPLQTLPLPGALPPDDRSLWWDIDDRQALYSDGGSALKVRTDNVVIIDRINTTYQQTAAGVPDATFRNVETMFQLMFVVRYLRTAVSNRHSRQALADENPYNLAEITTPDDIRNTLIHAYNDLVRLGVCEKAELFARYVVVSRDPNNADRANAYLPTDVVNQLRVFGANITAFLEYPLSGAAQ